MNELVELEKKREGYIMKKDKIEVKCTPKFVKHWENRGFKIIKRTLIVLVG